jgi:SAM-dependent methyltransferase
VIIIVIRNNKEVLEHWNRNEIESMYDKFLLNAEIRLIKNYIPEFSKILDAGCGEGEGTLEYSKINGTNICAVDFSDSRLTKAKRNLRDVNNVTLKKVDFLSNYTLDTDFDIVISQRFIINLMSWNLQKKVIKDLMNHLKTGGYLLMLEGYKEGVDELNKLRKVFKLPEIPIKWHNLFLEDKYLIKYLKSEGFKIIEEVGFGEYFFLTRGIRPYFNTQLTWEDEFNNISSKNELRELMGYNTKFSRLKLWVITK